ncbi:MAG TPA: DUF1552 domain-containing protein [Gammaproteobacteria bacterium]
MFVTRKFLPRRTFLRGLGATVAVPLLDAMVPARTALAQTAAAAEPRLVFVYFPHGAVQGQWTPSQTGRDFEFTPILEPLERYRDQLTIVSGLSNQHAYGPVHAITPATWLSSVSPRKSQDPLGGVTADQIAAAQIGQNSPLPSLEIATEVEGGAAACDSAYGCSFVRTISFRTPTTPLPMEVNPRKLFRRLFGQGDSPEERELLTARRSSILDLIAEETEALRRVLGGGDQAKLDDYLDSVREIERRIAILEDSDISSLDLPDAPIGVPADFNEHIDLMFDLLVLAFEANLTRIATFMMAAEVSDQTYNHIGVRDAFHPLSHHQNNPGKLARLTQVQAYHSEVFARFLERLRSTPDGDGSMLDNSILLYGSNMSDSNAHTHDDLPLAVVGGGAGRLNGGTHIREPDGTPISNLVLTLLQRAGVEIESLGDSTGVISAV